MTNTGFVVVESFVCAVNVILICHVFQQLTLSYRRQLRKAESGDLTHYWLVFASLFFALIYSVFDGLFTVADVRISSPAMCNFVWYLAGLWSLMRTFQQLFFIERIGQTFKGSSLRLADRKKHFFKIAIIATGVLMNVLGVAHMTIRQTAMSGRWHDKIHRMSDCLAFQLSAIDGVLIVIMTLVVMPIDFALNLVQLRFYVRRLFWMVERMSQRDHAYTASSSMDKTASSTTHKTTASHEVMGTGTIPIFQPKDGDASPPLTRSITISAAKPTLASGAQTYSASTSTLERSASQRRRAKSTSDAQQAQRLASHTTVLVVGASVSSMLAMLMLPVLGQFVFSVDITVNVLSMYFCFAVANKMSKMVCAEPTRLVSAHVMPQCFALCRRDCCECSVFDCECCDGEATARPSK